MNIRVLSKYGEEQAVELKQAFLNGKLTREEYREELVLLADEGCIEIEP